MRPRRVVLVADLYTCHPKIDEAYTLQIHLLGNAILFDSLVWFRLGDPGEGHVSTHWTTMVSFADVQPLANADGPERMAAGKCQWNFRLGSRVVLFLADVAAGVGGSDGEWWCQVPPP